MRNSVSDPAYMLDTNVFNAVLEAVLKEDIAIEEFRGLALFVTHVQADELHATQAKDPAKAAALLGVFAQMGPEEAPTRSAVWDVDAWDRANWSDEDGIFGRMLLRLKIFERTDAGQQAIELHGFSAGEVQRDLRPTASFCCRARIDPGAGAAFGRPPLPRGKSRGST